MSPKYQCKLLLKTLVPPHHLPSISHSLKDPLYIIHTYIQTNASPLSQSWAFSDNFCYASVKDSACYPLNVPFGIMGLTVSPGNLKTNNQL